MGLRMSTGFGLSNFNAKDSPFANPKPVSQAVSAFGDQSSAPKVPVPATPGSVFGQTSVIGAATKPSPGFAQPAFGSPPTPSASPSATPSSSKTASSNAFSAFSGSASAFGKTGGPGVPFSDMLRAGGSSPDSNKLKELPKTPGSASGSTPATPKSAFDASPTPQPAKVPASHESDEEEEKGKGQPVSAGSSFSNLSSSTSSFVDVPRGGEEEEEEPTAPSSDGGDSDRGEQQIEEFLSDTYSEGESDKERDEVEDEEGDGEKREERDEDDGEGEGDEDHGGDEEHDGTEDVENNVPPSDEADPTTVPLPASRSPSSTPKAERPSINVQPTPPSEPSSNDTLSERVRSTTPPGTPSKEPSPPLSLQTPLQQPTPTLPSPSLSPSPSPAPAIGFGRPNTRPLRSSPLANTPVSGGDEEEVKGEKPPAVRPHPASPKPPFGQWDGGAMPPSPSPAEVRPTPPQPAVEPLVDQTAKAKPSAITRPKTPPLLGTKEASPNNNSSSSSTTATVPVTSPMPALNLGGFSLGAAVKPDTKPPAEDATRPAATPAAGPFTGFKPGAFSLMPKPEPIAGTPPVSDTKPNAALGTTAKLPLAPAAGSPFVAKPGVATSGTTATGGKSAMSTPTRVSTAPPLVTPPKDSPSGEPLNPIQIEFTNLITGIGTELASVSQLSHLLVLALSIAHVASLRLHSLSGIPMKLARGDRR